MGNAKSSVIVVSGVNGAGKTTSIGKLGKYFKDNNRSVVFGAADTFRAAAIDQLQVWAAKVKVDIIKSEINSDPASVAFKTAEFDIMYGEGISKTGEILDLGVEYEIIEKSGSWFSYAGTKLGQGRDSIKVLLKDNPELMEELEGKIFQIISNK